MGLTWYSDSGATSAITTGTANTEVYAKISFKKPTVRAVYVDWDDGTSNKKDEANYQWVELTEPRDSVVVSHTYNKTGNTFNPVIQTINSEGIASRYWSNEATSAYDGILAPVSRDNSADGVLGLRVNDNKATANLRVQARNMKSGIDNTIFAAEGPHDIYLTIAPTLTSTQILYAPSPITIEVEAMCAMPTAGGNESTMPGQQQVGYSTVVKKEQVQLPTATGSMTGSFAVDFGGTNTSVTQVLSVKYVNPKITGNNARDFTRLEALNSLKIFVVAKSRVDSLMRAITYVSAGSPYKSVDDSQRFVTLDFSQSRPSASNISNSYYYYDNGKGFFGVDYDRWGDSVGALDSGKFTSSTKTTSATKPVYYTYTPRPQGIGEYTNGLEGGAYTLPFGTGSAAARTNEANWWWSTATSGASNQRTNQFTLDDFGRFNDTMHLVRNSVEPSSGVDFTSSLSGNAVTIARITPVIDFNDASSTTTRQKGTKFDAMQTTAGTPLSGCYTEGFSTQAFNNNSTNALGAVSLSGMNTAKFGNWDTASGVGDRLSNEYFICLWDAKTNEIFLQCTPWWNGNSYRLAGTLEDMIGTNTGLDIAGVSYLRVEESGTVKQRCEWVPLDFKDTTKSSIEYRDTSNQKYTQISNSFTKPGYITFDMPLDWSSIKMEELYGGVEPGANNTASDPSGAFTTAIMACTGSTPGTLHNQYGSTVTLSSAAGVITGAMSGANINGTDVGAYNYIAQIRTDAGSDVDLQSIWVSKITANNTYSDGYVDGTDQLFLGFGNQVTPHYADPGANAMSVMLRRINFYEVFPGASKLYTNAGAIMNTVDAGIAAAFPNQYGFKDYTTAGGAGKTLKDAWYQTSKYPMLITISGALAAATAAGGGDTFHPELWNVIDATRGFTAICAESDDSAYNLNGIPITSDVSIGRSSNFYTAITRKGKAFITKTGIELQEIGFSSVALGDETSASVSTTSLGSTYDYLHRMRKIQAENVRIYWDEKQKDGTYVRFWGYVKNINETSGLGGPRKVLKYTFTMIVEEIALLDVSGSLMTDIFPLGGIENERNYS